MRSSGLVASTAGLGPREHVGWAYSDPAEFHAAALQFTADGLAFNQRVMLVGAPGATTALDDVDALGDVDALVASGQLVVTSLDRVGDAWAAVVSGNRVEALTASLERALADGYDGLRIAADVTALLEWSDHTAAYARWEHTLDSFAANHPFAALCGMDRAVLGDVAMSHLACLHPLRHAPEHLAPFALIAEDDALVLTGDVDTFGAATLERALSTCASASTAVTVNLDLGRLAFIDHHGVEVLTAAARDLHGADRRLVLRAESDVMRDIRQIIDSAS